MSRTDTEHHVILCLTDIALRTCALSFLLLSQFFMHAGFNFYLNESVVMYNSLQISSTTPSISPNKRTETRTYFHCCINSFFHLDTNNFWECFICFMFISFWSIHQQERSCISVLYSSLLLFWKSVTLQCFTKIQDGWAFEVQSML